MEVTVSGRWKEVEDSHAIHVIDINGRMGIVENRLTYNRKL